jgi:hypothetical protein
MTSRVRKAVWCAVGLAVVLALFLGLERSRAATLAERFPDLAGLPDATTLDVKLTWQGLSPLSPMGVEYKLALRDDRLEGAAAVLVATTTRIHQISVPRAGVRDFLASAGRVALTEEEYRAHLTHTDDYPYVGVSVNTALGSVLIETASQPEGSKSGKFLDRTPWAIKYMGRTFVTSADDLDKALEPLLADLQYEKLQSELVDEVRSRGGTSR